MEYVQDKEILNQLEEKYIKLYLEDDNYICLNKRIVHNLIGSKTEIVINNQDYEEVIEILNRKGIEHYERRNKRSRIFCRE